MGGEGGFRKRRVMRALKIQRLTSGRGRVTAGNTAPLSAKWNVLFLKELLIWTLIIQGT